MWGYATKVVGLIRQNQSNYPLWFSALKKNVEGRGLVIGCMLEKQIQKQLFKNYDSAYSIIRRKYACIRFLFSSFENINHLSINTMLEIVNYCIL